MYIRNEISQIHGLIPILMKRRNGERWSAEERLMLRRNLQALSNLSPYLIPLVMPGGVLILPALAWWLDIRRHKRKNQINRSDASEAKVSQILEHPNNIKKRMEIEPE